MAIISDIAISLVFGLYTFIILSLFFIKLILCNFSHLWTVNLYHAISLFIYSCIKVDWSF